MVDHDGWTVATLTSIDLLVASAFRAGTTPADAWTSLVSSGPIAPAELSVAELEAIARRLLAVGLLRPGLRSDPEEFREAVIRRLQALKAGNDAVDAAFDEARRHHERTGQVRPVVVAFDIDFVPMLSLGMLVAYAQAVDGGRLLDDLCFAPL